MIWGIIILADLAIILELAHRAKLRPQSRLGIIGAHIKAAARSILAERPLYVGFWLGWIAASLLWNMLQLLLSLLP